MAAFGRRRGRRPPPSDAVLGHLKLVRAYLYLRRALFFLSPDMCLLGRLQASASISSSPPMVDLDLLTFDLASLP